MQRPGYVIIGPVWFGILLAAYYGKGFHKRKDIGLENGQTFAEKEPGTWALFHRIGRGRIKQIPEHFASVS